MTVLKTYIEADLVKNSAKVIMESYDKETVHSTADNRGIHFCNGPLSRLNTVTQVSH